jgi:hypothetical protein
MSESSEPLPEDVGACQSMIREQQRRIATLRRLVVGLMGYDPTESTALEFVRSFAEASQQVDPAVVEAELAAEDAMRTRRRKRK